MKKYFILLIVIISSTVWIIGCNNRYYTLSKDNIAELRQNIYTANDEHLNISFTSGYRENQYVLNGYATDLIEFGIITVFFNQTNQIDNPTYSLTYQNISLDGTLEQNPFDGSYMADIKKIIDTPNEIIITIKYSNFNQSYTLNKVNQNWEIDDQTALKIAVDQYIDVLKDLTVNNKLQCEFYVRMSYDKNQILNDYYWLIEILTQSGQRYNILIDVNNGDVLSKS